MAREVTEMNTATTFPELTADEAAELITQGEAVVIDVNPRRRWSSGHLPGAVNLDPSEFTEADLPRDRETTLIFYCSDTGSASRYAARKAAKLGFLHIFLMPCGLKGWMAAGHRARAGH
jgi:rhodanese-related sulfurtransferase